MSAEILRNFYSCVVESILTSCITVWYDSATVMDRKRLQRVVKTAERIIRTPIPSLQSIYNRRVHRRAVAIIKNPTHPQHGLVTLLPSGCRYISVKCRTTRLKNSSFPTTIRLHNSTFCTMQCIYIYYFSSVYLYFVYSIFFTEYSIFFTEYSIYFTTLTGILADNKVSFSLNRETCFYCAYDDKNFES